MTKISDHDFSKESVQQQEFLEEVRNVFNNGTVEIDFTSSTSPDYSAPIEPRLVLSVFGGQIRLYLGVNSVWYYATLTAL